MSPLRMPAAGLLLLVLASASAAEPPAPGGPPASAPAREIPDERAAFERRLATEVWDFGFEEKLVLAPRRQPLPGEWERYLEYFRSPAPGPDAEVVHVRSNDDRPLYYGSFPDFLRVEVVDRDVAGTPAGAVHGGRRALRMSLSGVRDMDMVAVRRRVPLKIDPGMAYELNGWVRLEGAVRNDSWALLRAEWLDADRKPIGRIGESAKVDRAYVAERMARPDAPAGGWVRVPQLRVDEVDPGARFLRVWCVASGQETAAWASFDDLSVRPSPRLTVTPGGVGGLGILSPGEPAALTLHFQGLEPEAAERKVAGYRRTLQWTDLEGGSGPESARSFAVQDLQGNGFTERVSLVGVDDPGVYAVKVELEEVSAAGTRHRLVRRVVRLVRLAQSPAERAAEPAGRTLCAVDADLYSPDAPRTLGAFELSGLNLLAFPVWQMDTDPRLFASITDRPGPEDAVVRRLRDLAARRVRLEAVLAPVPAALRGRSGAIADARAMYRDVPRDTWAPLVSAAARQFGSFVSEWRVAAADDTSLVAGDPGELVADLHRLCGGASGWTWSVPVPLAAPGPAGATRPDFMREIVHVPAETDADSLDSVLRPGGAGDRRWFLELRPADAASGADLKSERRQAGDLARKLTVLAARGASRVHVAMADRFDTAGRTRHQGLLGPGLVPRAAYSAYSLLAGQLSGTTFVGEFDLAPDARAYAFERGGTGLVVYWRTAGNRSEVPCQLGTPGQAELLKLTGRRSRLRPARSDFSTSAGTEMVPLSDLPALLVGVDPAYVLTRRDFRPVPGTRLEARYRLQEVGFEVRNHFPGPVRARVQPRFPRGTQVVPAYRELDIATGEAATVTFSVRPSFVETVGDKEVDVDLWIQPQGELARKRPEAVFSLTRKLPLESALELERSVRYPDDRTAEIEVRLRLRGSPAPTGGAARPAESDAVDAEVSLTVPGERRQTVQILGMHPGSTRRPEGPFKVRLGPEPRKVYLGARVLGSERFANLEMTLPAAGATR